MRVGVIGYGDSGRSFCSAAMVADGVELTFVGGRNVEKAKTVAEKFDVAYGTVEEMLKRDDVDCVAISTPPGRRLDDCLPVIESGRHLMIEKPMAIRVDDCRMINEAAAKAGVKVMVTHTHRYHRVARAARKAIEDGVCGTPIHINVGSYHDYFTAKRSGWQLDWSLSGGGVTMNPFIHMLDHARYLSMSEIVEFDGVVGFHKDGYDIESDIKCWAKFKNGATAFVEVDGSGNAKRGQRSEVYGTEGMLDVLYSGRRIDIYRGGGVRDCIAAGPGAIKANGYRSHDGYYMHMAEMRDAIEKDGPIISDGSNGQRNVEICNGILEKNGIEIGKGRK